MITTSPNGVVDSWFQLLAWSLWFRTELRSDIRDITFFWLLSDFHFLRNGIWLKSMMIKVDLDLSDVKCLFKVLVLSILMHLDSWLDVSLDWTRSRNRFLSWSKDARTLSLCYIWKSILAWRQSMCNLQDWKSCMSKTYDHSAAIFNLLIDGAGNACLAAALYCLQSSTRCWR